MNPFFCKIHGHEADRFCTCQQPPVVLCANCCEKHQSHCHFQLKYMTLYRDIGYNTGDLQSRIDTLKRCKLYVKSAQMEQVESRKVAAGMITAVKEAYLQLLADRESAFNALCVVRHFNFLPMHSAQASKRS